MYNKINNPEGSNSVLEAYGWNTFFEKQKNQDETISYGKIIIDHGTQYKIMTEEGLITAQVSGRFRNSSEEKPVIGDFVGLTFHNNKTEGLIQKLLERQSEFSRKIAGNTSEKQVQGANFDTVFIVMALNNDFNPRKLERFTLAAWDTGATPVVILTKTDLCQDVESKLEEALSVVPGVDVYPISAVENQGLEVLTKYMIPGKTIALFGASGVGKSTLINAIAGHTVMKVNDVRHGDDQGKHTTTHRELIMLDSAVMLMDTPGMRELGIWDDGSGVDQTFSDINLLSEGCKFSDCAHEDEPGCAIRQAIADGELDAKRYDSYMKLKREAIYVESKSNERVRLQEKKKHKALGQFIKNRKKSTY